MQTLTYNIPNISCRHCTNTIKMEVSALDGVQSVDATVEPKQVTITFQEPATEESIKTLLAEINFPPVI
ncbi:MAG: heavy metal transporter [Chloroflexota bacterium]|nr:MAG: heavy metal transporter [Chloroflexota bacterium]